MKQIWRSGRSTHVIHAAVVALITCLGPALAVVADGRSCDPKSVLPELRERNATTIDHILEEADKVANSNAVLWRVEKDGLAPSFLFGTVHVTHETLTALDVAVLDAISASRVVALEAEEMSRGAYSQAMAQAGKLMSARDKPLQRLLGDDDLRVVEKEIEKAGYPADLALGIRPWVATLFLASSDCQVRNQEAGLKPLDLLVSDAAKRRGVPLVGLETMLEQFETLASVPDEEQGAWLRASIEAHDRLDDITHTMVELYHARRLAASWELTREMAPRTKLSDATLVTIRQGLVTKRNERMLERSLPLLEKGGAFIAVGAMHLIGEDGLVASLRSNGFGLEPIQ